MERWREELYYNTLMHYGIKGMRKGVRRFQNADGSLTAAGERRYIDSNTSSRIQETISKAQTNISRSASGANGASRVSASTRQRNDLESGDRSRRTAIVNRNGHIQRVQDVPEEEQKEENKSQDENRTESTQKSSTSSSTAKSTSRQSSGTSASSKTANRPQSRPKTVSEDTTVKEVEKRGKGLGYGSNGQGQTISEFQEKQRQEQLARAERERAAIGKTANRKTVSESKTNSKTKKTTTAKSQDRYKKKGQRYVAKLTR